MEMQCELLEKCGFFKKYIDTKNLACRGFIKKYCIGPSMNQCERKKYREKNGKPPIDDMMPDGNTITV